MVANGVAALRRRVSILFDDAPPLPLAARLFNAGLAGLIVVNVTGVILESVVSLHERYEPFFWWLEQSATLVFAAEYLLRVWTAIDLQSAESRDPLWGRLRYMRSFFALIDLIAVLPAVLGMLGAGDLRTLRLLRLLRMLKLTRHATIFGLLWDVFREEARSIAAVLFLLVLTLTISGALMYMIEGETQPDDLSSIPAAMWWAIETLTTVGYGDIVPKTVPGRILGGVVSVVGVAALALFTSLITISFMDQLRHRRELLRQAIAETGVVPPLSDIERRAMQHIGRRLDLPDEQIAETVAEATAATATLLLACPHCGHPLEHANFPGQPPMRRSRAG
jgi:voltage-gated potassium channel